MQLYFRRVKLLRRSRWLETIIIPLPPSWFLRAIARRASRGKVGSKSASKYVRKYVVVGTSARE